MTDPLLGKDQSIRDVVGRLRTDLGRQAFVVTDHWELDLCAIGISSPKNDRVLVYISTCGQPEGRFDYELELPPLPDSDAVYAMAGRCAACEYSELLAATRSHLARDGRGGSRHDAGDRSL